MSMPQALTPAERALMQRAIPAWKEWTKLGLSLSGSLLTYQYAYKQGWMDRDSVANNAANQTGNNLHMQSAVYGKMGVPTEGQKEDRPMLATPSGRSQERRNL